MKEILEANGYTGSMNPYAINIWFIEKHGLYVKPYFSLFTKNWHIDDYITDSKKKITFRRRPSASVKIDKGYGSYKAALIQICAELCKTL